MTYLLLNLAFTAIAILLYVAIRPEFKIKTLGVAALALTIITAFGDNFIVGMGIVDYNETKILGVRIGVAPVEDFFYAIIAIVLVPAIWVATGSFIKEPTAAQNRTGLSHEPKETK